MTRLLTVTSIVLLALFTTLVGVIHAQPYGGTQLQAILSPLEGCPAPCFMGIRLGETTADEAMLILEAQPCIEAVVRTGGVSRYGSITWHWKDQPVSDGEEYGGELQIINDEVRTLTLRTPLTFGDIWLLLDHPDQGVFIYVGQLQQPPLRYLMEYYLEDFTVRTVVSCRSFWQQQALVFINFVGGNEYLTPYDLPAARHRSCEGER